MLPVARLAVRRTVARTLATSQAVQGHKVSLNAEQIHEAWVEYFDNADYWDLRRGLREMMTDDAIPTPEIMQAVLYACRRANNLPAAIRCIEAFKLRCGNREDIYDFVMQELEPTLSELGIMTPEELNLDIVVTEY